MIYYETDYLMHHGVKGMKWGVRKQKDVIGNARRQWKIDYKDAKKTIRKNSGGLVVSPKDFDRNTNVSKAIKKANRSQMKYINEKAKLAKMRRGEKGEFNSYVRQMSKSGAPGSAYDASSGGRSTMIYTDLKKRKGKEYADRVFIKTRNQAIGSAAVGTAAALGVAIAAGYLATR